MDPLFKGINVKKINQVEYYDDKNNRIVIEKRRSILCEDYDGMSQINEEKETEVIDLNGIKDVEIIREDSGDSKGCCCCKFYKIIYRIFHINVKDEKFEASNPKEYWQSDKDEDKSNIIKKEKMRELGFI